MNKRVLALLRGPYLLAVTGKGDTPATDVGPIPEVSGTEHEARGATKSEEKEGRGIRKTP